MIRPTTVLVSMLLTALALAVMFASRPTAQHQSAFRMPSAQVGTVQRQPTGPPPPVQADDGQLTNDGLAAHDLPDRRFTRGAVNPDVTQQNMDTTICVRGYTRTIRPPSRYTSGLKRQALDDPSRGYVDRNMRDYEEDHDVPLEVGGDPADAANLWPEPLHGAWNAHLKDRLENRIHELVCGRQLSLAQGRAVFLGDWVAGYQRYVAR